MPKEKSLVGDESLFNKVVIDDVVKAKCSICGTKMSLEAGGGAMLDISDTTLDQIVFEYLTSKNYQTTLASFCNESPSIATLCRHVELNVRRPSKVQYSDIVRRKIRQYLLSYFVETDTFLALMAPIRQIENALDDLKSVLKSTDSGYDGRALNYLNSGVLSNRKSDVLDKDVNSANVYPKVCTPTNSRQLNSTPRKENSQSRSLSRVCKSPNPKNTIKLKRPRSKNSSPTPSMTTADLFPVVVDQSPPQQQRSSSDARLWDKAVDQHIAHTFVPDTVARAINMSSMTSDCLLQTDIKKVINKIESDPAMMSAFESILVDYFNNVSSSNMDYDQNAANSVNDVENLTAQKPIIQRNSPETELLNEFMIIGDTTLPTMSDCSINDQSQNPIRLCQNSCATKQERKLLQKLEINEDNSLFSLIKNPVEDNSSGNQSMQKLSICDEKPQTSQCDINQRKCENSSLQYEFFDDIHGSLYTPQKISNDNVVETIAEADLRPVRVDFRSPAAKKLLFDDLTSPRNSDLPIKRTVTSENRRPSVVLTPERIEAVLKKLHRK